MQVDGFTVLAQVVNFLVLVYLLKRFLYAPVIDAMDRREQRVTERLRTAEAREQNAVEARDAFQHQSDALEADREAFLERTRQEAARLRDELVEEARAEVEQQRKEWYEAVARERDEYARGLREESARGAARVARRVLDSLANEALEDRVISTFLARLETLDDTAQGDLRRVLSRPDAAATLASARELATRPRQQIRSALETICECSVPLEFEVRPELVCGVELRTVDWTMSWNVDAFLGDFEEALGDRLREAERISA